MKEKRKGPFFVRLLKGIFKAVIVVAVIVLLAAAAGSFYLHYKYGVNVLSLTGQLVSLNKGADDSLSTVNYTSEDLASAEEKAGSDSLSAHVIRFTDKEITAYIAQKLDEGGARGITMGAKNTDTDKLGLKLYRISFSSAPAEGGDCYAYIKAVCKISNEAAREVTGLPDWLFYKLVPREMFVT
ncbi:MAG: hypothetical protein J6Z34_00345, partial [Clostridia bacterium]|nr:hypothetical protein [Clostridia bacterium]